MIKVTNDIVIEIDERKFNLSLEDAKHLHAALGRAIGKDVFIPYYPYIPPLPVEPSYPIYPQYITTPSTGDWLSPLPITTCTNINESKYSWNS